MEPPYPRGLIDRAVKRADAIKHDYRLAKDVVRQERDLLVKARGFQQDARESQRVIQILAQTMQENAHAQIAGLVSRCLSAVFDEPYTFKIHFEAKRGKTDARFAFERDGHEVDPLTASGGGVIDVAAFALRLASVMLSRPKARRLLLLDESFRFVSAQYHPALAELLHQLSDELKIQIILVTHIPDLAIGTRIKL